MNTMRALPWLLLLALLAPATAGDEEKAGPKMDELSKKLVEGWRDLEYNAGAAGAKRASADWAAVVESPMGKLDSKATYVWNGKKGKAKWANEMMGQVLAQEGFGADMLDGLFNRDLWAQQMKGLTLAAKETDAGTEISVTGKSEAGYKTFHFDKNDVLSSMVLESTDPQMGVMQINIDFTYTKDGGKYFLESWSVKVPIPGMGDYTSKAKFAWTKVGDYHVYSTAEVAGTMAGQPAGTKKLAWTNWKFNDDVKDAGVGGGKDDEEEEGCGEDEQDEEDEGCEEDEEEGCGK